MFRKDIVLATQVDPILCLESALVECGITRHVDHIPVIYYEGTIQIETDFLELIPNYYNLPIIQGKKYKCSEPSHTLCEMIIRGRSVDLILDGISDIIYMSTEYRRTREELLAIAKLYGVEKKLSDYIKEMDADDYI